MFVGLFSRLTDSCLTSMGRSANTPADAQTHPWGTATRARCDKAQGLFADLAGGLPFPGHRLEVKETLPEERPLTTLLWESLVKGLCRQNNTSLLPHENSHGDFSELTKKINRTCLFSSTLCFILMSHVADQKLGYYFYLFRMNMLFVGMSYSYRHSAFDYKHHSRGFNNSSAEAECLKLEMEMSQ